MESKCDLRKSFRHLERRWREDQEFNLLFEQGRLTQNLAGFLKNKKGVWAGYQALSDEPSLVAIYNQSSQITWAFPVVQGSDLHFWIPQDSTNFAQGTFGIQEPVKAHSKNVSLQDFDGVLVPGQAFDRRGVRLGRGQSFYDRALKHFRGLKVGVCFSPRLSEKDLPKEAWDIAMDFVITEKEVIEVLSK